MSLSTKNYSSEDFQNMIYEHLTKCNDIELVILKGHVLIEYMLNHFMDKVTNDEVEFENARFSFSQKTYLFELLGDNVKELHDDINLVNKLRNDIAHRLTFNKQHLATLLSNVGKKYSKINQLKKSNQTIATMTAITFLCGALYGQIESQTKKKEIFKDFLSFIRKKSEEKSK